MVGVLSVPVTETQQRSSSRRGRRPSLRCQQVRLSQGSHPLAREDHRQDGGKVSLRRHALVFAFAHFPFILPVRLAVGERYLHGRHLVFRAVGRPVGELGGDDVGARHRVMEGGVNHALRHALGHIGAQRRRPHARGDGDHLAVADAAHLSIVRVDFQNILGMPGHILGAARLRADIVLRENAAGGEDERELAVGALVRRHIVGDHEAAKTAHELSDMHDRCAIGGGIIARPLHRTHLIDLAKDTPLKVGVTRAISSMISEALV